MGDLEAERRDQASADKCAEEQRKELLADMDAIIAENMEALEALAKG